MSWATALLVALAGAAGALLREAVTRGDHPAAATAALNVVGAAALGAATVLLHGDALLVVGGGLLGAATTFSTWMVQAERSAHTVRLLLVPALLGVAAAAAGRLLAMLSLA